MLRLPSGGHVATLASNKRSMVTDEQVDLSFDSRDSLPLTV